LSHRKISPLRKDQIKEGLIKFSLIKLNQSINKPFVGALVFVSTVVFVGAASAAKGIEECKEFVAEATPTVCFY
jgi:hypothetical protein